MEKASVDVRFNTTVRKINYKNQHIQTLYINNKILSEYNYTVDTNNIVNKEILFEPIAAKYIIDSTGNCEIGKILNCEFIKDSEENQPMSLRFMMSGIDFERFSEWLMEYDRDCNVTTCELIDGHIHLSTAYTWDTDKQWALAPLFDDAVNKNLLKDTDRNYFQVFSVAGMPNTLAFNCPRIVEKLDPNDVKDVDKALKEARQAIFRLSNFCKIYFPGFDNAFISNIADVLGVRVLNRIRGKYVYTYEDLISGKKFENPAVISNYPVDVHSVKKDSSKLEKCGEHQLPIEALMSKDYDNLFVAGRCLSADFKAQGALRVQASCSLWEKLLQSL